MVLTPFKKAVRRTAHKCLEVESTQREVLFLFRMLGSLSGISDYLIWEFMEFHWGLLLMNLLLKSETNQDFQFHSLFLRGTHLPLDIFHTGKWKLGECIFPHTRHELFKYR